MAENNIENSTPEFLFHVKRCIIDNNADKSGASLIRGIDILGTFTDLAAAKNAAHGALAAEGYRKEDFELYQTKDDTDSEEWAYGDGVLVFGRIEGGTREIEVGLDTKPNVSGFQGSGTSGEVMGHLHYVLQTTINYSSDRIGVQATEVEGTYATRKAAFEAAETALLDADVTKDSFAEYDEKEQFTGEWPYGDECWVHAVGQTGQNFLVFVKTQPNDHQRHECKPGEGKKDG